MYKSRFVTQGSSIGPSFGHWLVQSKCRGIPAIQGRSIQWIGQKLYLPTNWFHYIASFEIGIESEMLHFVQECEFKRHPFIKTFIYSVKYMLNISFLEIVQVNSQLCLLESAALATSQLVSHNTC